MIGGIRTMTAATGHGKKAARAIDRWLHGETYEAPAKHPPVEFGMLNLPLFLDAGRTRASELPAAARQGFAEVGLRHQRARGALRGGPLPLLRKLLRVRQLLRRLSQQAIVSSAKAANTASIWSFAPLRRLLRPVPLPCDRDGC